MPPTDLRFPVTPPDAPTSSAGSEALSQQLRVFKILVIILLLVLVGGAGAFLYVRHQGQPVTILLDNQPITTVHNVADANRLLTLAEQAQVGSAFAGSQIVRLQAVKFQPAAPDQSLDPDEAAQEKLAAKLKLHVRAYAIFVNGKPSIALPSNDAANATLQQVKDHFAQMPPNAEIVGSPTFTQKVEIRRAAVAAVRLRATAAIAAPYFWTPPPSKAYVVQRGDTGYGIGLKQHLSLTDLIVANPGVDLNRLKPGDAINVQKMPALLTVRVQKKYTRDEPIVANAPPSAAGKRQVTYQVTFINGQETKRDVLNIVTLEKPETRMQL